MALATPSPALRSLPRRRPAPVPVRPPLEPFVTAPHREATAVAGAWPDAARLVMADLAVAAMAASALAERCDRVPALALGPLGGSRAVSRRAVALEAHLDDVCRTLRADLDVQGQVVLPVLRTAPLGLRLAVVRASCERVLAALADVERCAADLAAADGTGAGLRELAAAVRRLRSAVAGHRRLWTGEALPLARELLREGAAQR